MTEQPTKKVAQVVSSFAYTPPGAKDALWLTSASTAEEIAQVPQEVLEAHEKTGFVRFVDVPISAEG